MDAVTVSVAWIDAVHNAREIVPSRSTDADSFAQTRNLKRHSGVLITEPNDANISDVVPRRLFDAENTQIHLFDLGAHHTAVTSNGGLSGESSASTSRGV